MTEEFHPQLVATQIAVLERFREAGFRFVPLQRYARHLAVEKEGFVALLEISEGRVKVFGQVGYYLAGEIAMLVERKAAKGFAWHETFVEATPDLLAAYARVKEELRQLLEVTC